METIFSKLKAPFPPEKISWRVGPMNQEKTKGIALAYIDARDVMERLDEVCGMDGWQCRYPHANGKTVCEIGIRAWLPNPEKELDIPEWIWKADGAGDSDIEAEKGALSDAFKRAAVRFGIGRYLYAIESPWVEIDKYKKIKDSELPKLRKLLGGEIPKPEKTTLKQSVLNSLKLVDSQTSLEAWYAGNEPTIKRLAESDKEEIRRIYGNKLEEFKETEAA